jgi:hypothetical protein
LEVRLLRWPTAARVLVRVREVILMLRSSHPSLLAAFALALMTQILTVLAVLVLARAIKIGLLSAADYMFAVPLTLIVNALPLTPSGIGVGEVAFDQFCRWLEPTLSGAAYSSIFFAFRVVSTLTCSPASFRLQCIATQRTPGRHRNVASSCDNTERESPPRFSSRSSADR